MASLRSHQAGGFWRRYRRDIPIVVRDPGRQLRRIAQDRQTQPLELLEGHVRRRRKVPPSGLDAVPSVHIFRPVALDRVTPPLAELDGRVDRRPVPPSGLDAVPSVVLFRATALDRVTPPLAFLDGFSDRRPLPPSGLADAPLLPLKRRSTTIAFLFDGRAERTPVPPSGLDAAAFYPAKRLSTTTAFLFNGRALRSTIPPTGLFAVEPVPIMRRGIDPTTQPPVSLLDGLVTRRRAPIPDAPVIANIPVIRFGVERASKYPPFGGLGFRRLRLDSTADAITWVRACASRIIDAADWSTMNFVLVADLKTLSTEIHARLYDKTAGSEVVRLSTTSTSGELKISGPKTLTDGNEYELQQGYTVAGDYRYNIILFRKEL